MSDQETALVREIYDAFARGDVDAVLGAMADEIEWYQAEGMPYGEPPLHGPQEVAQSIFGPIITDVEGFAVTPEQFLSEDDIVVMIGRYTGTGKETGKELDLPAVHVWNVRDGKATRFRQFIDTAKFLEVVPAQVATTA